MSARYRFKIRRDSAANWTAKNPVLLDGEPGLDTTADRFKIGDGVTPWVSLPEVGISASQVSEAIDAHATASDPHGDRAWADGRVLAHDADGGAHGGRLVPEGAWQQVTTPVVDVLSQVPVSTATVRWVELGRTCLCSVFWEVEAYDAATTPGLSMFVLDWASGALPTPRQQPSAVAVLGGFAIPGSFGYVDIRPTEEDPAHLVVAAPGLVDLGSGPVMVFIAGGEAAFGFEANFGDGLPVPLAGRSFTYQGRMDFESEADDG